MNRLLRIAALAAIAAPAGAGEPLDSGADIDRIAAAHIGNDSPGCALGVILRVAAAFLDALRQKKSMK